MTPWVQRLLVITIATFLLSSVFPAMARTLLLVPLLIPFRPWSVITYMFVHAGLWHLFFNMLALYFFGPRLELRLGGRRFLRLYLISGLVGALASLVTPRAAIIGASAATFGVMLGYARYWPRDLIYIWGVLPVQARWLVVVMTVLSLYGGLGGGQSGVAHFAHLGGFLGGFLYLTWLDRSSPAARFKARASAPVARPGGPTADRERWGSIRKENLHPVNRDELERLLAKVADGGPAVLAPDERAFLDRLSEADRLGPT